MKKMAVYLLLFVALGGGCFGNEFDVKGVSDEKEELLLDENKNENSLLPWVSTTDKNEYIQTVFLDFYAFKRTEALNGKKIMGTPLAGIVNHHNLAMDIQAKFFKSLKLQKPNINTFIIISPDHFLAGSSVSTHDHGYLTPHGLVESRVLATRDIYIAKSLSIFENEHGVGSLAPFIAREFPDAIIVPVYIRPEVSDKNLKDLSNMIKTILDDKTFIIISSDMSHYLIDSEARNNDIQTLEWLKNNNWQKLSSANDDYTDSAKGFKTMKFLFNDLRINPKFLLLDYAVSTDYGGGAEETTSYITGFFVE